MSIRRALIAALAGLAWLSPSPAAAEVRVRGLPDAEAAALEAELAGAAAGRRDGVLEVTLDRERAVIVVRFTPASGAPVEREVPADADAEARSRTVRWLVDNMTRDEAAELVDALGPRPAPPPLLALDVPAARPPAPPPAPDPCAGPHPYWPVSAALASPFSVPWAPPRTHLALSLLYQDVAQLDGAGFGTAFRVRCDTNGALFAEALTITQGAVRGAVVSSGAAVATGDVDGALVSAGLNVQTARTRGALVSGGVNVHTGPVYGAVVAPVNVATADVGGLSAALLNVSTRPVAGAQLGFANVGEGFAGLQMSFLNVAFGGESTGAQVGFVNVARKVRGAQVGFFNVAEEVDAAVGLVSVSWAKRLRPYAWASNLKPIQVGLVLEGKRMFSAVNLGRLASNIQDGEVVLGAELGVHVWRNDDEGFLWDVVAGVDGEATDRPNIVGYGRWGTRVGYRFMSRLAPYVYAGNALIGEARGDPPESTGPPKLVFELGGGAIF